MMGGSGTHLHCNNFLKIISIISNCEQINNVTMKDKDLHHTADWTLYYPVILILVLLLFCRLKKKRKKSYTDEILTWKV